MQTIFVNSIYFSITDEKIRLGMIKKKEKKISVSCILTRYGMAYIELLSKASPLLEPSVLFTRFMVQIFSRCLGIQFLTYIYSSLKHRLHRSLNISELFFAALVCRESGNLSNESVERRKYYFIFPTEYDCCRSYIHANRRL
jgi:hypothetical protein